MLGELYNEKSARAVRSFSDMQRSDNPSRETTNGRRVFLSKINGFVSSQKTHTSVTARGHNAKYVDILRSTR